MRNCLVKRSVGKLFGSLLNIGLPLTKYVLTPHKSSAFLLLRLTKAASTTDAAIQRNVFRSETTKLLISIEEMHDIMEIIKSFEESSLLIKRCYKNN